MDLEMCSHGGEEDEHVSDMFGTGDILYSRYEIVGILGEGRTASVLKCLDTQMSEFVAMKFFHKSYLGTAKREIAILEYLAKHDISGGKYNVQLRSWFNYQDHICMVLEELGPSVEDFLFANNYHPLCISEVRNIGRQVLERVAALHDMRLVHADLKPENILCVQRDDKKITSPEIQVGPPEFISCLELCDAIKLIDFNATVCGDEDHSYLVSSDFYRAPEVILGLGWSYPCDLWGVGCILAELCSGSRLFEGEGDLECLAMMERVLGKIPKQMLDKVGPGFENYVKGGKMNWPDGASSTESIVRVSRMPLLEEHEMFCQLGEDFIDLLRGLLRYDPSKRLTARDALQHRFFTKEGREDIAEKATGANEKMFPVTVKDMGLSPK